MEVISAADITKREKEESGVEDFARYQDLLKAFVATRDVLTSDGPNMVSGGINTKRGALMDREELFAEL